MNYLFFLLLLYGFGELCLGIKQSASALFNNYSYQTICGTFPNPAPYSMLIVMVLPIAWFYVLQWKELRKRSIFMKIILFLSLSYVLMSLVVLSFSMSRTSWVAAIIACSIVTILYIRSIGRIKLRWNTTQKICAGIALLLLVFIGLHGVYLLKKDSADGRLLIWKISSAVLKEHFVTGVGTGYFAGAYGEEQEKYFRNNGATEREKYVAGAPKFAYNEYIQFTVEHGIVGLVIMLFVLCYSFYHLLRADDINRIPVIGALICLLIVSFFSYPFHHLHTCLLSVCIMLLVLLVNGKKKKNIFKYALFLFALVSVSYKVCFSFGCLGDTKIAYKQWNLLKPYFDAGQFDEITENYAVLYPYLKTNAAFLFEYGQCLSQIKRYEESNQILQEGLCRSSDPMFLNILGKNYQQLGKYPLAEQMFYKAYYRIPHKIYPLYLLMNLYKEQHREEDMLSMAHQIMKQKEKVHSPETEYIKNKVREEFPSSEYSLFSCGKRR